MQKFRSSLKIQLIIQVYALQVLLSFDLEGGIAKMVANKLAVGQDGRWLLPFWREMGGQNCTHSPSMHGKAGVLVSDDQVP